MRASRKQPMSEISQIFPALRSDISVSTTFSSEADAVLSPGDCRDLLAAIPNESIQLVVTSPPYNIGKQYERRATLDEYLAREREVIDLCIRKVRIGGSICWQ